MDLIWHLSRVGAAAGLVAAILLLDHWWDELDTFWKTWDTPEEDE